MTFTMTNRPSVFQTTSGTLTSTTSTTVMSDNDKATTPLLMGNGASVSSIKTAPLLLRQRNSGHSSNGNDSPPSFFISDLKNTGSNSSGNSNGSNNSISSLNGNGNGKGNRNDSSNNNSNSGNISDNHNTNDLLKRLEFPSLDEPKSICHIRTREQMYMHFRVELHMLWRDSGILLFGVFFQWIHIICTNLAYIHQTLLTAAQRVPLQDVAFESLPVLNGSFWWLSEITSNSINVVAIGAAVSILFVQWNAPHGRPLYLIPSMRRYMVALVCLQALRSVSFLITTLPGASRQCLYHVPETMSRDELLNGAADDSGNPEGWSPPTQWSDILWTAKATTGCGDLMFSSHTIFTMCCICLIWNYFDFLYLKWTVLVLQIVTIPFILAAHKHYSVDVFTALYVTPLIWEVLKFKMPDMYLYSADMKSHYGITFEQVKNHMVLRTRRFEYCVEPTQVPLDLRPRYSTTTTTTANPTTIAAMLHQQQYPSASTFRSIAEGEDEIYDNDLAMVL